MAVRKTDRSFYANETINTTLCQGIRSVIVDELNNILCIVNFFTYNPARPDVFFV
jgi:hypothetical protein